MAAAESPVSRFNTDYLRSPPGRLRISEGLLALAALISTVEGYCENDNGRYGFFLFVIVTSMLQAILIIILFVLRLEKKITFINIPISLLLNDCVMLLLYFIGCVLTMLSIGRCHYRIAPRIIASLFAISLVLTLVGVSYTDYVWWYEIDKPKDTPNKESGTTVTEISPTVLA